MKAKLRLLSALFFISVLFFVGAIALSAKGL